MSQDPSHCPPESYRFGPGARAAWFSISGTLGPEACARRSPARPRNPRLKEPSPESPQPPSSVPPQPSSSDPGVTCVCVCVPDTQGLLKSGVMSEWSGDSVVSAGPGPESGQGREGGSFSDHRPIRDACWPLGLYNWQSCLPRARPDRTLDVPMP